MRRIIFFLITFLCTTNTYGIDYSLSLTPRQLCDLEMLLNGGFAPLESFLNQKDYESVLKDMRLSDGSIWPIPITLDIEKDLAEKLEFGDQLYLKDPEHRILAILSVQQWWRPNKEKEATQIYGTDHLEHPGVAFLFNSTKEFYVSGSLKKLGLPHHYSFEDLRKTPRELKEEFKQKGIDKVVAFQTRNPMHRAHIELTQRAMKDLGAHLLIQPIVGLTKPGDVDSYVRVECYRKVLNYYSEDNVSLSVLPLAMRMAGPREALWHALIRKNCGATHFIVGRDHAGPGIDSTGDPFYPPYAAQNLVKQHAQEIGIELVPFQEVVYSQSQNRYISREEVTDEYEICAISGTEIRRRLETNEAIPSWFSYPEILDVLRKAYIPKNQQGLCVFFTGLSGAGKSTLSLALQEKLKEIQNRPITMIDGDEFRKKFCPKLGFSKEDRSSNVQRAGYVADVATSNRGIVICSLIAPYEEDRAHVRRVITENGNSFIEVYLSTSLETCETRDVKGIYKKVRSGLIQHFTGIDDPYEIPSSPELVIDTADLSTHESIQIIVNYLKTYGYL